MAHLAIVAPARPDRSRTADFGLDHHLTPARSNPRRLAASSWSKTRVASSLRHWVLG
jgi:hypothetical protein